MTNFRQEIYTAITGQHQGYSLGNGMYPSFSSKPKSEKLEIITNVGRELRDRNDKYAGNKTPHRYTITDLEAQRILDAIENKEEFTNARACYDSLDYAKGWE